MSHYFFGPYFVNGDKSDLKSFKESAEEFLEKVESKRVNETYKHEKCTGNSFPTDGQTDQRSDRKMDRRTDGMTDGRTE